MIVDEEDYIEHFGKKGMKWGIRQSEKKSGVDRSVGAKLDRNARRKSRYSKSISGHARSTSLSTAAMFKSKHFRQTVLTQKIKNLDAQSARIKAGKSTTMDKLQTFGGVSIAGLFISRRPTS